MSGPDENSPRRGDLPLVNIRTTSAPLSGVQRYTLELCARLRGRVEPIGPRAPLQGIRGHLWEQLVLPARVGQRVLWSPGNVGPLAVTRQVLTVHDVAVLDWPESFSATYRRWYSVLLPRLVRRVARIIVDSEFTRQRLAATTGAPAERMVVIHLGVEAPSSAPGATRVAAVCGRLGIRPHRYVLTVGTLEPRKNVATLLEAWARISSRFEDDVHLVVVGGEGRGHLFAPTPAPRATRRVVRTGAVSAEDLAALYAGALLFVTVSLYEGFGLPPLEAAAVGVPVVASEIPVFREMLGESAAFVNPRDPAAVAETILELTNDAARRDRLRALGLSNVRRFNWDRAAAQTLAVLQSV